MMKIIFTFAGISGLIAVVFGAFGAHGLRGKITDALMHAFETAVLYQFIHTLVLLVCLLLMQQLGRHWAFQFASYSFVAGILLFSGSLYLMVFTGFKWLGPITPLGGLCFIAGWMLLSLGLWQKVEL